MARRKERADRAYVSDEQRSQAGCLGVQNGIVIPGRVLSLLPIADTPMKDATSHPIELETEKVQFLRQMAETYGLPDIGKAVRCLINYARENPDRHEEIFAQIRCLDC